VGSRTLVTDAETRSTVAAIRGLAGAGHSVSAVAGDRPAPGHWSRHCQDRLYAPHPLKDEGGFISVLERALATGGYSLLLPGSDASLLAISASRERLEQHAALGLPAHDVVLACMDKLALAKATAAWLPSPEMRLCSSPADARAAAEAIGFPLVLKAPGPRKSATGASIHRGTYRVEDQRALIEVAPRFQGQFLAQRSEPGVTMSFAGVFANGALLAECVSQYLRTWRPDAGNASLSVSVAPSPELRRRVEGLLKQLGWQGIFELELIERPDGSFAAIDFNPRVYGSMALAIRAGANLPMVWLEWLLSGKAERKSAHPQVKYRWEDGDLRHLLWQARRRRLGGAVRVLRPYAGVAHAHFERSDPLPLVARGMALGRHLPRAAKGGEIGDPSGPKHQLDDG
jgi:predicted ATP-grasp superfamily ATP-dependent carboligase